MSVETVRLSTWSAGQGVGVSKLFRPDRVDRAPVDFFRGRNSSRTLAAGLCDRRPLFAPGFSDISAGSAARVSETAVSGCGFPVMTGLGHGLQVVPIKQQDLVALTKRVLREIRDPQPLPAAA